MHSWNINIAPKLGLTIISLIEVHMAMGKANAENKEEEELVTAPLQTKALNEAKRCSAPSSQVSCPTFPRRSRNLHQFLDHVGLQMQATNP